MIKISESGLVGLLQLKGLGRNKLMKLVNNLSFEPKSIEDYYDILIENNNILKLPSFNKSDLQVAFDKGSDIVEKSENAGIKIISLFNDLYPSILKSIKDPPILLNAKGNISVLDSKIGIAIIGTRTPTTYGYKIGERLGKVLAEQGFNIVSGLAKGCDTSGHIGALNGKGTTTAILAHGLDYIYPKENKELANRIIENNGLLVSEYFVGAKPFRTSFVERDRIQAGLSKAIVVVETDIKGGTMHTVNYGIDYKKVVCAYNHPIQYQSDKSRGNQFLINNKNVIPLTDSNDIESLVNQLGPNDIGQGIPQSLFKDIDTEQLEEVVNKEVITKKKSKKKSTKPKKDQIQKKLWE